MSDHLDDCINCGKKVEDPSQSMCYACWSKETDAVFGSKSGGCLVLFSILLFGALGLAVLGTLGVCYA